MFTRVLHKSYDNSLDLTGKNLIGLAGVSRPAVQKLIPFLVDSSQMTRRFFLKRKATAMNGEVAAEVHEFENLIQSDAHITRLLFRNDRLIQITFQDPP